LRLAVGLQPRHQRREVLVLGHVDVVQQHLAAELREALLEELRQALGVVHGVVGPHHDAVYAERLVGVFGHRVRLHVIAEAGHEHGIAHHVGQLRRGRARGHERQALFLEQRRRGQCEGGVAVADGGDHAIDGDATLGAGRGFLEVVLGIDRGDLDHPAAKQAAGIVDLLRLQLDAVERRYVDRGHTARAQIVQSHYLDRVRRPGLRRRRDQADDGCRRHGSRKHGPHSHTSLWRFDPEWVACRPGDFPIHPSRSGSAIPNRPFGRNIRTSSTASASSI